VWNGAECASVGSRQKINEVLKRPITKRVSPGSYYSSPHFFYHLRGEVRIEMTCRRGQPMGRRNDCSCDLRRTLRKCVIKKMAYFVSPLHDCLTLWNPISNRIYGVMRADSRCVNKGEERRKKLDLFLLTQRFSQISQTHTSFKLELGRSFSPLLSLIKILT